MKLLDQVDSEASKGRLNSCRRELRRTWNSHSINRCCCAQWNSLHYIDFPADDDKLHTKLTRNIALSNPCVASPMYTVTESAMAVAVAQLGGIGIIHSNATPSQQAAFVRSAKSRCIPFVSQPVFKSPDDVIGSKDEFGSAPCVLVAESGRASSKLLGYVSRSDWSLNKVEERIVSYMVESPLTVPAGYDFDRIGSYLASGNSNGL